jgi:hypothetical protein
MSSKPVKPIGAPALVGMAVGTLVLGLVVGLGAAFLSDVPGQIGVLLTAILLALGMAGAMWLGMGWWRRVDEAAREAHKWSWFWGGSCGMAVGFVCLLTVSMRGADLPLPTWLGETPQDLLVSGMMTILLFQVVGYLIAWAGWWWARR